ncbi:MAG: hypothetical protein U0522_02195 [Candidatus Paceibacterota bacterium]
MKNWLRKNVTNRVVLGWRNRKVATKWIKTQAFSKNALTMISLLATFIIVGIVSKSVTPPDFYAIWSSMWPVLAWIGGVILLIATLFWIRPDPRKWSWGKILKIVWILIILVPSFVVAISGVIGLVVRASTPKVIATSVAGSTNLLITSEPGVWSDWQNLPSNVKKVTILSDKELDLELQQADGGVVKAKHLPGRQIDLGREKLTGPVMAFRSRPASTSGNKVFQYTAICDLTEQQR